MTNFATVEDINSLFRQLNNNEVQRANALLEVVSNTLRLKAEEVGIDLDEKINKSESYKSVVKSVVVDIVARVLMTSTINEPISQFSQSAMGYSVSGTFLNPGGGLFIKRDELARLGLKKQRYGAIDIYDTNDTNDKRNNCNFD